MLDILQRAEILDGYRATCAKSPLNRIARQNQVYDLTSISSSKTAALTEAIEFVALCQGCEFALLDSTADAGMPHTRAPNVICLPASFCNEINETSLETLAHEGIHIHQRRNGALWDSSLFRAGWTRVKAPVAPEITARLRVNPDTMGSLWAWRDWHVPLPLFFTSSPRLGDVRLQWLDLRMGTLFPQPPPSFPSQLSTSAAEHPYELYAYQFSEQGIRSQEALEEALRSIE